MSDENSSSIDRLVQKVIGDANRIEVVKERPQKFVMIAWRIEHACAAPRDFQEMFDNLVVHRRPPPISAQRPAVNKIAHDVKHVWLAKLQKFEELLGSRVPEAQVNITDENGSRAMTWYPQGLDHAASFQERLHPGRFALPPRSRPQSKENFPAPLCALGKNNAKP
jgi:hypothetical protein